MFSGKVRTVSLVWRGEKGYQTPERRLTTLAEPSKRIARLDFFQPREGINKIDCRSQTLMMT
jgi:hypothetical protein